MMSFMVVMKGPVAKAGSSLILFRISGISVPKRDAKIITTNSERLTVKVSASVSAVKIIVNKD